MKRAKVLVPVIALSLPIGACGVREPLEPAAGTALPRAPALSSRALTPDELLAVPSEFRPVRVDEPLTRSERRPVDRFALPPADAAGTVEAEVSELEDETETAPANPPQ